jgi:prepilin-type N-terminal cleavage/methylation domain-containing protein
MRTPNESQQGFTLIETMIAIMVLTVGAVGMASVFLYGMNSATSSPNELIATQKANEALESVIAARDAHTLTWNQLRNTSNDGIFQVGAKAMNTSGKDGILNTGDQGETLESVRLPGYDQTLGTADDQLVTLNGFTREIRITDLTSNLRKLEVIIEYRAGTVKRTYSLTTYMSSWA